jgi:hypothetical protein
VDLLQTYEHEGLVLTVSAYAGEAPARLRTARTRTLGSGPVDIGDLGLTVIGGDQVALCARVAARAIAFIYTEVLLKDPGSDRFYGPVAREHVHAGRERTLAGVTRPEWDAEMELSLDIRVRPRVLSDGVSAAFCFATPEGYGDPHYRVDGLYRPAGSAAPMQSHVIFDAAGEVKRVVGLKGLGRRLLPRPLDPGPGASFTPFIGVYSLPDPGAGWSVSKALGGPLMFGRQRLRALSCAPFAGEYLGGLVVEDLDGRLTRAYAPFIIGGDS